MPAALAIPLIMGAASAGTQLVGAKMASNSAKNAAKTQAASGKQALDLNRQLYQDQQQRQQPYIDAGQQAMGRMGQMGGPAPMFNGQQPGGGWQNQQPQMGGQYGPQGMMPPDPQSRVASQGGGAPQMGAQMGGQMSQAGGGTVKMMGPDGRVRDIPAHMVAQAKAQGGRQVG